MTLMSKPQTVKSAQTDSSTRTSLGVLVIGRKRPGFDQEWNAIMRQRSSEAFTALGYDTVGADSPVIDDQTIFAALARIRAAGCEALVVLQPSLGNGQLCMTVAHNWPDPIVLLATPERPTGEKVSSCSLVANHLWASALRQAQHSFELVIGDPDSPETRQALRDAVAIARTAKKVRAAKIGLIGTHAPGFIDMAADPFVLSQSLGTQLHHLSLTQFIDRCKSIPDADVARDLDRVRAMELPLKGVTIEDLAPNSRYYLALRDLIKEEALDGLAVQCWPELSNLVGHWPYLAFTRLTNENVPIAMEGDSDAALLSLIANHLHLGVGFITDWLEHDARTITFWHAGVAPFPLCYPPKSANGPYITTHFNINKPAVVDGSLRENMPVTITRLWRCDNKYHLMAFHAQTIPPKRSLTGNTAFAKLIDGPDVPQRFDTLCHAGMPHHVTLFQGHHTPLLKQLARSLSINWVETT